MTIFKKFISPSETLTPEIETKLKIDLQYTSEDIAKIKTSPTLVGLLNTFDGTLIYKPNYNGAFHKNGVITLGKPPYNGISYLAHELGHAVGDYQASTPNSKKWWFFDRYDTAREYADDRERAEGEAIAYEVLVGEQLLDNYNKRSNMWYDHDTEKTAESYVDRIKPLLNTYVGKQLYTELGKVNAEMIASGRKQTIDLTYDERNVINFLQLKKGYGEVNNDYQEAMGDPLYTLTAGGYPNRFTNTAHVKSLTNKAHGHYGENADDLLINGYQNGTPLAQKNNGDLLYGGNGNDSVTGNSGVDILLGGDGNDSLYGNAGNDILAGNKGDDYLYGGAGKDRLQGGKGFDTYYADLQDTITDSDRQGKIYLDVDNSPLLLTGGEHRPPYDSNIYKSADDTVTYEVDTANDQLYISHNNSEQKLTIDNWHNNDLGISATSDMSYTDLDINSVLDSYIQDNITEVSPTKLTIDDRALSQSLSNTKPDSNDMTIINKNTINTDLINSLYEPPANIHITMDMW